MFKTNKIIISIILISIIATGFIYGSLPDKIPFHWNINGEIDAWTGKIFSWFIAILPLAIYFLMIRIPEIDPKKESYSKHKKAYELLMVILVLSFTMLHWIVIFSALGYQISVSRIIPMGIGFLFIIMGNYMGQIRPNYSFGIKTPWTLANEIVWKKTHRIGGFAFILSGLIFIIAGIINRSYSFILAISSIFLAVIYIIVFSYFEYRKRKEQ